MRLEVTVPSTVQGIVACAPPAIAREVLFLDGD